MHIVSKPLAGFQTPYASAVYILSGRWQVGVLDVLRRGKATTYDELKDRLSAAAEPMSASISDGVLSAILKELEIEGCVLRTRRLSDLKVVFCATEKSRRLMEIVDELSLWSEEFAKEAEESQSVGQSSSISSAKSNDLSGLADSRGLEDLVKGTRL